MQAQLLISALRRRSEFRISTCPVDIASILESVGATPTKVVILSLNHSVDIANQMAALRRVHLSHPCIAKVLLVESYDRELVVSAFRSGARGIFCISNTYFRLLCRCILRVADGQVWANTEQMQFLLDLISEVPSLRVLNSNGRQILTPREEQVVDRLESFQIGADQIRRHFAVHRIKYHDAVLVVGDEDSAVAVNLQSIRPAVVLRGDMEHAIRADPVDAPVGKIDAPQIALAIERWPLQQGIRRTARRLMAHPFVVVVRSAQLIRQTGEQGRPNILGRMEKH